MEDGTADTGVVAYARIARTTRVAALLARCGSRLPALLMCVTATIAISGAPAAAAAAPGAPRGLVAQPTSMGLSVALSWSPASGAARYRIYRLSSPFTDVAAAHLLGETDGTSFLDQAGVRDGSWFYAVTAVHGSLESPPSGVVSVHTSGELDGLYSSAVGWLASQQQSAQAFRITFDQPYPSDYAGRLSGQVEDPAALGGDRIAYPYVSFSGNYSSDYVGPVHGQTNNIDDPSAYVVQVFSTTDTEYVQGTFGLNPDGSWSSGGVVAHAGVKSARLVRKSDGLVVAVSGGPDTVLTGVAVRIYSHTDIDYLQEQVPLGADGRWVSTKPTAPGEKIARLVNTTTGRVLNSTEWSDSQSYTGLVRSFSIPQDDPDYGYDGGDASRRAGYRMEQRSFIYDDALAVLAFLGANRAGAARAVLTQLARLQSTDGSLPFSVDDYLGQVADDYKRSGALAWVGYAAVQYEFETGSDEFRPLAEGIARYLESLQVTEANGYPSDDPRYGSVLGGWGEYDSDYNYIDAPVTFASTEHNIDAYFFFRDLGYLTSRDPAVGNQYAQAAQLIKQSLLTHFWDAADQRFYQGVSLSGPDRGLALDLSSWGGLFLLAVGDTDKAREAASTLADFRVDGKSVALSSELNAFNQTYSGAGPFSGYMPYAQSPGYSDPPEVVWAEGTWGALLLRLRLGEDVSSDLASMQRLEAVDPQGGFVQTTAGSRSLPYEFHVWPAVGGTAWAALVTGNPALLWAPDGWRGQPPSSAPGGNPGVGEPNSRNLGSGTPSGSSADATGRDSSGPARTGSTPHRPRVAPRKRVRHRQSSASRRARSRRARSRRSGSVTARRRAASNAARASFRRPRRRSSSARVEDT